MPEKKKRFVDRVASLFSKKTPSKKRSVEYEALLRDLERDHARLSAEVEEAFLLYDAKTRAIANRLAEIASEGGSLKELRKLQEEQFALWKVIRRAQAASRQMRHLEEELEDWSARTDSSVPLLHPDHPSFRTEIIASELRSRGKDPSAYLRRREEPCHEGSARDADPFAEIVLDEDLEPVGEISEPVEGVVWDDSDREHAVIQILDCATEIKRMIKHEDCLALRPDILELVKELRDHHAALRLHDRRAGIRRHRLALFLAE